jgi:phosphatidylglycerol---prolipoprotein diacylglyceryl transferase
MGLDPDVCPALAIWVIPASLAGAKIFAISHYLLHGGEIPLHAWYLKRAIFGGGLIAYGGVLAGLVAAYLYFKIKKLDFPDYADAYAPALGLGICIMRLGCFFSGCCWGKGDFTPLALSFPIQSRAGLFQAEHGYSGLFPSQVLASFDGLVIMAILLWLERRIRIKGMLFLAFVALYSAARMGEDYTRFYETTERMLSLTYNQWISLAAAGMSGLMAVRLTALRGKLSWEGPGK